MNQTARARLDPQRDLQCKEILVVDDEKLIRDTLGKELEDHGYQVRYAESGELALRKIEERVPDLVVLDKNLGGIDGTEVCRRIKSLPRTSSIPVIMLTADDKLEEKLEALESGADDYVIKREDVGKEVLARVKNKLLFRDQHRDASPLTQLPGNPQIEREVRERIGAGVAFAFLYADIDEFKAYNDFYGHQRGDGVIRGTAELLKSCVEGHGQGSGSDFIGHVGGDDFIVICAPERAQTIADTIVHGFDVMIRDYFDPGDIKRGYIELPGRTGRVERYRLTSLTVAGVQVDGGAFKHSGEVSARAAEIKRNAKARARNGERGAGSHVAWDRRSAS